MDETSVLGVAITYMKHLQERVKILEQQQAMESSGALAHSRSQIIVADKEEEATNDGLQEIEAKISGKSLLLRFHCKKHKGVLVKILSEVEKLNLAVVNTSVTPFGNRVHDITIIAEMEEEFSGTAKDVMESLRTSLCPRATDN